jgi:hypothetical protein
MTAPVAIDRVMTLTTMRFEKPDLIVAMEGNDTSQSLPDLERVHLYWGSETFGPETPEPVARLQLDQSRKAVRQALNESIRTARDVDASLAAGPSDDVHWAIFERIRDFASRYGALWGVNLPDPMPRHPGDRKLAGSMLDWYRELLTLLDVSHLVSVASGKREDRTLRGRIADEQDGNVAVFRSRAGERYVLATRNGRITLQLPWEPEPRRVDPWALVHGRSPDLAWVILTAICKSRLDGRLNIGFHPSEHSSLAITPNGIGPTLFARLWLDCLHQWRDFQHHEGGPEMVRLCQRPECERPIAELARADALYCGGTCQKADRRRLRRLEAPVIGPVTA